MIKRYSVFNENIRSLLVGPTDQEMMSSYNKENHEKIIKKWIEIGYIKGIKMAMEDGLDLNENLTNYLSIACLYNQVEIIKLFLDNGIKFSHTALRFSYEYRYTEVSDLILKKFNLTFEKYVNKYPDDYLYLGVHSNNIDYVKDAIKLGSDVNPRIDDLLYKSVVRGYNKVAICLILHGANINKDIIEYANKNNPEISELLKNY